MSKLIQFNSLDIEELAAYLAGYEESDSYEMSDVEEKLMEEFNIDLSYFQTLISRLAPLMDMAVSPLTEEPLIGFGTGQVWIAKKPFPGFINQVLIWLSAEKIQDGKGRAFERTITSGGKPEFKIVLMKADQEYSLTGKEASNGN
jgi:hypothetical protein